MSKPSPINLIINATPLQDSNKNRGIGRYTAEVCKIIIQYCKENKAKVKKFTFTFVLSENEEYADFLKNINHPQINFLWVRGKIPEKNLYKAFFYYLKLQKPLNNRIEQLKKQDSKVIYFLPAHTIPVARKADANVVMVHDLTPLILNRFSPNPLIQLVKRWEYLFFLKQLNKASLIITNSQDTAKQVNRYLKRKVPTQAIYLGLSPHFRKLENIDKSKRPTKDDYFIYYGGYDYVNKNIPELLKTFIEFNKENNLNIPLALVGGEKVRGILETYIDKPEDLKYFIFLPYLDDDDLVPYVYNAKGLIRQTLYEGFGLPELETLALGKPVIQQKVGAVPEFVGDYALLNELGDRKAAKKALLQVYRNRISKQKLKQAQKYTKQFTWQKNVDCLLEKVEKMLN